MERLRGLGRYQIALLVCGAVMILVFSVLYPVTTARVGFLYQDTILTPAQEGDTTVYSGKLRGEAARFTVHAGKSVEFQYGDKIYGPYTVTEDPDACPDSELSRYLTGVEVRCGDTILFRGGVMENGGETLLYHEDGNIDLDLSITAITSSGVTLDENGNEVDPMELSVRTILELTEGPELQHKGVWVAWFGGVFICAVTAFSILFADELFRWNLSFRVRDVEQAEPSDWEIASRYIGWTVCLILALGIFIKGLGVVSGNTVQLRLRASADLFHQSCGFQTLA